MLFERTKGKTTHRTLPTMKGYVSEEALAAYDQLVAESQGVDFAEGDTYDFTRCMRPDGSHYGTRGKCKKGTEAGAKEEQGGSGRRPRAAIDSGATQVAAKRKANPPELKAAWKSVQGAVKTAAAEVKRVARETKGDKSREALNRRLAAGQALDKAERAAFKASEKFFAAAKRQSRAAMTPEQRRLEREADKLTKGG